MLPKFNEDGYLPHGIHPAPLNEIQQRFGARSTQREELFKGLISLLDLMNAPRSKLRGIFLHSPPLMGGD